MMARPDVREPSRVEDRLDRRDGRVDKRLKDWIDQSGDRLAFRSWCRDCDEWTLRLTRLDQDENAIGHQMPPDSLEGMNHARDRDSSKRPAEECYLEWLATEAKVFSQVHAEGDVADACGRGHSPGERDSGLIGFDSDHARGQRRELASEPAVAATDLEDAPAGDVSKPLDEADLHPGRWIVREGHGGPRHQDDRKAKEGTGSGVRIRTFNLLIQSNPRYRRRAS
jgi:hypothetical protein